MPPRNARKQDGYKYLDQVSDAHLSDDTKAKIRSMLRAISEIESIDADMTKGMGSKMTIVVIAIITVETIVGTQPDDS